jgi:hypothetical protein
VDEKIWTLDTSSGFSEQRIRFAFGPNVVLMFELGDFVEMAGFN